jgi:hypothetical protein
MINFKSLTALGLVAVALAVTSITPAEAHHHHNNDKYMNELAMQYYMQNQANGGMYNPALAAGYGNPYGASAYGNPYATSAYANPYATSAYGVMPSALTSAVPYGVSSVPYGVSSVVPTGLTSALPSALTRVLPAGLANALPFNRGANGLGGGWNHAAFNNLPGSRFSNVAYNNPIASRFGNPAVSSVSGAQAVGSPLAAARRFFR